MSAAPRAYPPGDAGGGRERAAKALSLPVGTHGTSSTAFHGETPIREGIYRLAVRGVRALAPVLARGESKVARGVRGRRDAAEKLVAWGREARDPDRPLVWFHAPSVGEGFQARAVAEALRELRPDVQLVHTYFSPSAEAFAEGLPADVVGFLPWDLPDEVGPVLDALRPDLLAFTKTEVWPVLSREARRRDVPLHLVAATLPPGAGRLRPAARWLLRPAFRRLSRVAAVADGDAGRLPALGVPPKRVVVTGDPGIDSAAERALGARPDAPYLRPFRAAASGAGPSGSGAAGLLVAGSTWPPDEEVLVPAATRVRREGGGLRLVVAPHEPTGAHVGPLVRALEEAGWRVGLLGAVEEAGELGAVDAVVVDRVGVLAHLYTVGTMAYVGGGFHDDGLHSVLEPAAAGLPVTFGPRHANAPAAGDLMAAGGAEEVGSADALAEALGRWLRRPEDARRAGERARAWIREHRGAARRTAELLVEELEGR